MYSKPYKHHASSAFNDARTWRVLYAACRAVCAAADAHVSFGALYIKHGSIKKGTLGPFFVSMRLSVAKSLIAYVLTSGLTTTWSIDECGVSNLLRRGSV